MPIQTSLASFVRLLGFIVAALVLLWIVSVPHPVSPVTYLLFAGVACVVMAVASITYRNHPAPATAAQVLYHADAVAAHSEMGRDVLVAARAPAREIS